MYHGWKFDVDGNCMEMPNEPAASTFKEKINAQVYKAADFGGITWIYMGPRQADPPGFLSSSGGFYPKSTFATATS